MALIACPSCDREISDMAAACPQCGHPTGGTANPFAAPAASLADPVAAGADYPGAEYAGADYSKLNQVAHGQRLVLFALLISLFAALGAGAIGAYGMLLGNLVAIVLAIYGLIQMTIGFRYSVITQILLVASMLVPGLNWLVMLLICNRANKALKAAGYKVGLMGADQR